MKTRFATAAAIVHEMIEAQDEKRLLRLRKSLASYELLIIDELGFVPLSRTGAELLFELISQRCERGATIITSNLPFDEWTATFGDERLTAALLDRLNGRTFPNVVERGDHPSGGRACLDADDLAFALVRWIVDIYHDTPQRGLGGRTPLRQWQEDHASGHFRR